MPVKKRGTAEVRRHTINMVRFEHKSAVYRISDNFDDEARQEIVAQRTLLESFIERFHPFADSFVPLDLPPNAPEVARTMACAARLFGVGPMAAVAGAIAQMAVDAMIREGAGEAIVDNGGDIVLGVNHPVVVGLYANTPHIAGSLALFVTPEETPCAICSSSARLGHSRSFGDADLACVIAETGALADAAATRLCNDCTDPEKLVGALDFIVAVEGVRGALAIVDGKVGLKGRLPKLIRNRDGDIESKITAHPAGGLWRTSTY